MPPTHIPLVFPHAIIIKMVTKHRNNKFFITSLSRYSSLLNRKEVRFPIALGLSPLIATKL